MGDSDLDLPAQGVVGRVLRLSRFFERALAAAFHQFDVLATLRRCGGEAGLTASQPANRCMLSTAALTNRLDRLEAMNRDARNPWIDVSSATPSQVRDAN
jgi:DNA-binding MarR family transcriptional regulator